MMRVFGALGCAVVDEPFYAYWLKATQKRDDPGYEQTLAAHETDWRRVVENVCGAIPENRDWYYQKHMAIHMLPEVDLGWMSDASFVHGFLIRDPREVIASMTEFRDLERVLNADGPEAAAELVGIPQLQRVYDLACNLANKPPPVLDANDVLREPEATLGAFCQRIGMPFDPTKPLRWQSGQHSEDGAWAPYWYQKIFATTGLQPYRPRNGDAAPYISANLQPVVDACMPTFERLSALRIKSG